MKKILCAILCAALCLMLCVGMSGCNVLSALGQGDGGGTAKDSSVIFENEYCKQTVVSAGFDSDNNYCLGTKLENKTDMPLSVDWRICTVNGWVVDVWEWEEMMPNSTIVMEMTYYDWELAEAGITSVDELGFYVMISKTESESFDDILLTETYYYYPEGKTADEIDRFERQSREDDIVVEESDEATFIVESMEINDNGDWEINCFFANNSDKIINYSVDSLTVDGWIVNAYSVSASLLPNTCRRDRIELDKQVAEKSGISTPTELTFDICKYGPASYDVISEGIFTVYNSSEALTEVVSPERVPVNGEVTVVDNEYITMIVEECCEGQFGGTAFKCYFQNNSDTEISIAIDELTADGENYYAFWYQPMAPGTKTWCSIEADDLENFENVKKFEFYIEVNDVDYEDLMNEIVAYEP